MFKWNVSRNCKATNAKSHFVTIQTKTKDKKIKEKKMKEEQKIVKEVLEDFAKRSEERKSFETQWLMNMNFYLGNQYCDIGYGGNLEDLDKQFYWQEREIFNHIAPIVDIRVAKLAKIKPKTTVLPSSNDERDVFTAKVSKKIIDSISNKLELSKKIDEAMQWSEICGTSFFKITWDSKIGQVVATEDDGTVVRSGEVDVTVCSPFEIYPDSSTSTDIEACQSIIHARAMDADKINSLYGLDVKGQDLSVFSLDSTTVGFGGLGYSSAAPKVCQGIKKNSALVIERYQKANDENPNGRLTIVVGDKLFYDGENPFAVGKDDERAFPFVRLVSLGQVSSFWGTSVVDRLIPIQRAYNAVKNRKHEFINRLTMGILKVEDGSIDIDNLEEDGLCPGKVLVYRQGSTSPEYLSTENLSSSFADEEDKLLEEFNNVSGLSEVLDNQNLTANISGVALEVMVEQSELRLNNSANNIKQSVKNISQMILKLYKQFAILPRLAKIVGDNGDIELFYFNSSDISSDDIALETQNELGESLAQRRQMVFDLINAGLLDDKENGMSNKMKVKALEVLGFGIWENAQDTSELHIKKAENENLKILDGKKVKAIEIDDHELHIDRHVSYMLGGDYEKEYAQNPQIEEMFLQHIREHKAFLKQ